MLVSYCQTNGKCEKYIYVCEYWLDWNDYRVLWKFNLLGRLSRIRIAVIGKVRLLLKLGKFPLKYTHYLASYDEEANGFYLSH